MFACVYSPFRGTSHERFVFSFFTFALHVHLFPLMFTFRVRFTLSPIMCALHVQHSCLFRNFTLPCSPSSFTFRTRVACSPSVFVLHFHIPQLLCISTFKSCFAVSTPHAHLSPTLQMGAFIYLVGPEDMYIHSPKNISCV